MAKFTINALLSMSGILVQRRSQLEMLRRETPTKTTITNMESKVQQVIEPTYDVKIIDKKITNINNALFEISQKVKDSNSRTEIEIDIDYKDLSSTI
jgi:hypothetical protein